MKKYLLTEETLGYVTAESPTNTDARHLVAGSRNVLVDRQRKVRTRNGHSRLGAASVAQDPIRNAYVWNNSSGIQLMLRGYSSKLALYVDSVEGTSVATWYDMATGFGTTAIPRFTTWYSSSLALDLLLFVWGDDNIYQWNGAMCVVSSTTGTTITKTGTNTFAQARFYTGGNKTLVNLRTGTEYTYTGGETSTTLTGIADTTGINAGDVLVQKVVTNADAPAAGRNNHTIFAIDNQIAVGSNDDNIVYLSKNTSFTDFTYSSPRVPGEGALFTLDAPTVGFASMPVTGELIIFSGRDSLYTVVPQEITVGTTLAETMNVKKFQVGSGQGAKTQESIVNTGTSILYLSNEPAVREIVSADSIQGGKYGSTLSNPIKPDFDAETWDNACAHWHKNAYHLSAPSNNRMYILEFTEDADGRVRRFWQAPQTGSVRAFSTYNSLLYGHSAAVTETYELYDPDIISDVSSSDEKIPILCVAKFAYTNHGNRATEKSFDEYFVEGEITPATQLLATLYYNFGGSTQAIERTIDGSDFNILEETLLNVSLAQQPIGQQPLGGSVEAPDDAAKFRAILEIAREDYFELQAVFQTNDVDKFWSIIARGPNAKLSPRQPNRIKS